jgi:tRNA-uridine 2-sulfurtransferase
MGEGLAHHLQTPHRRGALTEDAYTGAAGGAPCGDLVRISLRVEGDRVAEAAFAASGCGASQAAASVSAELAEGASILEAARLTPEAVSDALGGLSAPSRHAADLGADALHRALGAAARDGALALSASEHRTLVAMSGGVDSAAAAQLAIEAGDEVVGVTLELWVDSATDGARSCCSPQAVIGARALAHSMGIPHFTLDLRERFRAHVVDDFLAEYGDGRTPNPCMRCNGLVRFDAMLELADALGAARLATGHYARIVRDGNGPLVRAARDPRKDQSYVLARLPPEQLERLSFPLGGITKDEVRRRARAAGLPVADKRESQDLCFLAGIGGRDFMRRHGGSRLAAAAEGGEVVTEKGDVVGRHDGHHHFTVGQRRGLGLGGDEPLYVLSKDAERNRVVVGPRSALCTTRVRLREASLRRDAPSVDAVRLRYRAAPVPCRVSAPASPGTHPRLELDLARPAEAVAPGQTACLMSGDRVVGVGVVEEAG